MLRKLAVLFSTCLASLALSLPAHAQSNSFDPLPGWTHDAGSPGVVLTGRAPSNGSPLIAEIDGNPANGKEVAVAGADGRLHVINSTGQVLWSLALPNSSCGNSSSRVNSSPAVGELFGDGVPYVLVGYGGIGAGSCDGGVAAYRGNTGALLWNFSLRKFARKEKFSERWASVFATPALADVDGNGQLEIGFGAYDRHVYLLNANGSVRWYYQAADTVWASPAFADINADGRKEMIVATDISQNRVIRPPTPNGGYLYAFSTAAVRSRRSKMIRFRTNYLWIRPLDQVPWSSPVVADVLPANPGPEIIIGSGYYFSPSRKGKWIKIFSGKTGRLLQTLATPSANATSVAIADLNGDGLLDIVGAISGAISYGGNGRGVVLAWTPALSSVPLWTAIPYSRGNNSTFYFHSALIADLDCNGSLEVLVTNGSNVVVFNGQDGAQLTCPDTSCASGKKVMRGSGSFSAAPALGDINQDGLPEVVAAGGSSSSGLVYAWTNFGGLNSSAGPQAACTQPWPAFRGNAHRSGAYSPG